MKKKRRKLPTGNWSGHYDCYVCRLSKLVRHVRFVIGTREESDVGPIFRAPFPFVIRNEWTAGRPTDRPLERTEEWAQKHIGVFVVWSTTQDSYVANGKCTQL